MRRRLTRPRRRLFASLMFAGGSVGVAAALTASQVRPPEPRSDPQTVASSFHVEEATIADVQRAIQQGRTSCQKIVQAYIDRARSYNGPCTTLVTRDGTPIPATRGAVRAGSVVSVPTSTTAIASVLPRLAEYKGPLLDFGHMEATVSDPTVSQQYGMVVGIPNARQVNALTTLNIRGERSVTCRGECDAASGPLPAGCSQTCDTFRKQPDALEYARSLDARYGRHPDLAAMPMYCVALSFKDVYDTTDMRSTGGGDANFAMDAPPRDSTIVSELRAKGAIIYAKANLSEYNGGSADPGGGNRPAARGYGVGSRSTWGGPVCNPYDTTRETGGSSSGSAASVAANLVQCSLCEETGGSCRQPAWRNDVVALVTTKGLMPYGGIIGNDQYLDRAGIMCRTVADTARVLDALKDPARGYFDPRDIYSALPKALVPQQPYASFAKTSIGTSAKPLAGVRVGIVREYMVKHTATDRAMSDLVNAEIKTVLRDRLGAALVESVDPLYADDPAIPNMTYGFQDALAEILPYHMPEYFQRAGSDGVLLFAEPGYDVTKREYMVAAGEGQAPLSDKINIRSVNSGPATASFAYNIAQYLLRRGDSRITDWASLNANSTYFDAARVANMKNWEDKRDLASAGLTKNIEMREVLRLVILKVMRQNNIDVLVNPTTTIPPTRVGYANQPVVNDRSLGRFPTSANAGIPEITVPAGFNSIVYDPDYVLNPAKDGYVAAANNERQSRVDAPLPVGMSFWAGPGDEGVVIKTAAAYEAATRHRKPPPAFGAVPR